MEKEYFEIAPLDEKNQSDVFFQAVVPTALTVGTVRRIVIPDGTAALLRREPSLNAEVLHRLTAWTYGGAMVEIVGLQGAWVLIRLERTIHGHLLTPARLGWVQSTQIGPL